MALVPDWFSVDDVLLTPRWISITQLRSDWPKLGSASWTNQNARSTHFVLYNIDLHAKNQHATTSSKKHPITT